MEPHHSSLLGRRQVVPSILAADFAQLGEQVAALMDAGARIFQLDVMDGHFVPEVTMGPVVLQALRDLVHERGGLLDCHLMVDRPERHVASFAAAGADVITVHVEATPNVHYALQQIRAAGCAAGVAINPGTPPEAVVPVAELVDLCLCMTVNPGWGGQAYIPTSTEKLGRLARLLPPSVVIQVDGGISLGTIGEAAAAGAGLLVAGSSVFHAPDPAAAFTALEAELWSAPDPRLDGRA